MENDKIKKYCLGCGKVHEVPTPKGTPKDAIAMCCNYCPLCEENTNCYKYWFENIDQQLKRLKAEQDKLWNWCLKNIKDPNWMTKKREYNLLSVKIDNLKKRMYGPEIIDSKPNIRSDFNLIFDKQ